MMAAGDCSCVTLRSKEDGKLSQKCIGKCPLDVLAAMKQKIRDVTSNNKNERSVDGDSNK